MSVFPELSGRRPSYGHTFYGIGDDGAVAVTDAGQREIKQRLEGAGLPVREVDHGYCKSIDVQDPDGLLVEFTSDSPDADAIGARQRATAHETPRQWAAGDRTVNNDIRPHR